MIFRRRQDEMEGFRRMREALRQQADPQDHALLDDEAYAPYEDDEDDVVALLEGDDDVDDALTDSVGAAEEAPEGAGPAPAPVSAPLAVASDAALGAAMPAPTGLPRPEGRTVTTIGADASWSGTLRSESDVYLEGRVEGTLEVRDTVYIAEQAAVDARIKARSVVVAGQVSGTITCEGRLEVTPTGRVKGEINVGSLVVHEGAVIDGTFRMNATAAGPAR
ncbi:MAG: polymer-forming cytoskeletal protein [Chloroflexi bacterium]|nr:polymer-forming cytoskeletal protein [Chloroflexota bacterium]